MIKTKKQKVKISRKGSPSCALNNTKGFFFGCSFFPYSGGLSSEPPQKPLPSNRERKMSPKLDFLHKVFLRPPRVMDVRASGSMTSAQNPLFSCALSDEVKVCGLGCPPRYPPGRLRDVPPKNFISVAILQILAVKNILFLQIMGDKTFLEKCQ